MFETSYCLFAYFLENLTSMTDGGTGDQNIFGEINPKLVYDHPSEAKISSILQSSLAWSTCNLTF